MSELHMQRMSATIEGDFVIFLIGLRLNKPWKVHQWWPVAAAMPKMLRELEANPELGMLGYTRDRKVIIQYWRSYEHLEAYARSRDNEHLPAWSAFNRTIGNSRGDVGIWHETYLIKAGQYETVYSGMPAFGLGAAATLSPIKGTKETARGRLG